MCFNRYLKEYLQKLKNETPEDFENIDFYNLPQLACTMMRVPSVENDDVLRFLSHYEDYNWTYSHIVIDEGQDFDGEFINKLDDIALLQGGAFYIFYDKKQFVQGHKFPDWLVNAECRLILNINCRNTYQIADTSGKPVDLRPKVRDRSVNGDMPRFYLCRNSKEAIKVISRVADKYRAAKYSYDQICILTLKTESNSILTEVDKVGNHLVRDKRDGRGILFTSARKFKGLEADVIIIVDVNNESFADEKSKMLFYVGCSRAKHQLDILFVGDENMLRDAERGLSDQNFPNARIGIARCLNVKPVMTKD